MKKPYNAQDLEKLISERLSNYQADPSGHLKTRIFNALHVPWYRRYRGAIIIFFMVIPALISTRYYFGIEPEINTSEKELSESIKSSVQLNTAESDAKPVYDLKAEQKNADLNTGKASVIIESPDLKTPYKVPLDKRAEHQKNLVHRRDLPPNLASKFSTAQNHLNVPDIIRKKPNQTAIDVIVISPVKKTKRLSVDLDALTFITFQRIVPNTTDDIVVHSISSPSMLSTKRLGFRINSGINWELNKNFDLTAGIAAYSQRIANDITLAGNGPGIFTLNREASAYEIAPQKEVISIDESVWSMGAQLGIRYYLPQSNRKFYIGAHIDFQTLFDNQLTENFYLNKRQTYLNIETGWKTKLSDKFEFHINPNLSYSMLNKQGQKAVFRIYPFSFGLNVGIRYKLW